MISYLKAKQIAEDEINSHWGIPGDSPLLLEDCILERHYAWIFSYTSKRCYENEDMSYAIAGNGPVFVSKKDGRVDAFGSAYIAETAVPKYEEDNKIWGLQLEDTGVYADASRMRCLKDILGISMAELTILKSNFSITIDFGAERRLLSLQKELNENGIAAVIVANR